MNTNKKFLRGFAFGVPRLALFLMIWAACFFVAGITAYADGTIDISTGFGTGTGWSFNSNEVIIEEDGVYEITGTGETSNRITVNIGVAADITLRDVNINTYSGAALDMRIATVNLWLEGTNRLVTTAADYAGAQTNGGTLTIEGTGSLEAIGGNQGAGIGGAIYGNGGDIRIGGGTITAIGGDSSAGIGGGSYGNGGDIRISGGTVTANGGAFGSGIGGGNGGNGGDIDISGDAIIAATGGNSGAGIGGGNGGHGGNIDIRGTVAVIATGGDYGAGIGGGALGAGGDTRISGGIVTATAGIYGAGIGGGNYGNGANLTVSGGLAEVTFGRIGGGDYAADHGTTRVFDGNLSIANPEINIPGGVKYRDTDLDAECVPQTGAWLPYEIIGNHSYTHNGNMYIYTEAIADSQGGFYMFLPLDDILILYGDLNDDGTVDNADLVLLLRYRLGLISGSMINLTNADVYTDGVVDAEDLAQFLKYFALDGIVLGPQIP